MAEPGLSTPEKPVLMSDRSCALPASLMFVDKLAALRDHLTLLDILFLAIAAIGAGEPSWDSKSLYERRLPQVVCEVLRGVQFRPLLVCLGLRPITQRRHLTAENFVVPLRLGTESPFAEATALLAGEAGCRESVFSIFAFRRRSFRVVLTFVF